MELSFSQWLESSESSITRLKNLAVKYGWKYEPAWENRQENHSAYSDSQGRYPTLISPEGVIIALDDRDRYLHNNRVMIANDWDVNKITLQAIVVPFELRRQGLGTKALQELQKMADQLNMTIVGEPVRIIPLKGKQSLTQKQLVSWYKRHGWTQQYNDKDAILEYKPKKNNY